MATVAGPSDGLLIKHLWMKVTEEECDTKVRSDSSAARSMVRRQGIGRVPHMDASLVWIQQKEKETALLRTEPNCADICAKSLARKRAMGLLYMLKMVTHGDDRIGGTNEQGIEETDEKQRPTCGIAPFDGQHGPSWRSLLQYIINKRPSISRRRRMETMM